MAKFRITPSPTDLRIVDDDVSPGSVLVTRRVAKFYQRHMPNTPGGLLLDAGCGDSSLTDAVPARIQRVVRIDWPAGVHDMRRVDAFADLSSGVPLRDRSVSSVLLADVLEHVCDPLQALRELRRVLEPNGRLLGNVPFCYWLHEEPHDYFRYTEHGLRVLLTRAGFDRVHVEVLGGGFDVVVDIAGKAAANLPLGGRQLARGLQRACALRPTRPRGATRRLPLGYGFIAWKAAAG